MQKKEKEECVVCEKKVSTLGLGGKPICEGCLDQVLKSSCTDCPNFGPCTLTWSSIECVMIIRQFLV